MLLKFPSQCEEGPRSWGGDAKCDASHFWKLEDQSVTFVKILLFDPRDDYQQGSEDDSGDLVEYNAA